MANKLLDTKYVNTIPPKAITDAGTVTAVAIDTLGYDYLVIPVCLGATDIAVTALKLQESSDDASADAYADITGCVYGTSTDVNGDASALPADDDDNGIYLFEVDLRGRERYIKPVVTFGDGTAGGFASAVAILSNGEEKPTTFTERGIAGCLRA